METVVKKQVVLLTVLVVILLAALGGFFYVAKIMQTKQESVISAKERLATYEENKRAFEQESAELRDVQWRIARFEADTVTADTVPQFLSHLESVAREYNVTFTVTAVETPEGAAPQERLVIDWGAEGSLENILSLAGALQRDRVQIAFERFSVYASDARDSAGKLVVDSNSWEALARIVVKSF